MALVSDVAECMAPHAMIPPMEGWEGPHHTRPLASPLVTQHAELGATEFVYLTARRGKGTTTGWHITSLRRVPTSLWTPCAHQL